MLQVAEGLLRSLVKVVLHWMTGKSELERITERYPRGQTTLVRGVRHSLRRSKQLESVKRKVVVAVDDFSIKSVVRDIRNTKKFENPGLVFAVGSLRRTNVGISHLRKLAATEFSNAYEAALIELWDALQPGKQREGTLRHSRSWSVIGFQGLDPATDFRGAGMLSLENLRYFSRENSEIARQILDNQCRDITDGGFPFATTGINITAFILSLAVQRKLDDLFLFTSSEAEDTAHVVQRAYQRNHRVVSERINGLADETSPLLSDAIHDSEDEHLDDDQTSALALERFNVAYTVVFTRFAAKWREVAPRDAMAFPLVFGPFKKEIEQLLSTPQGIRTLALLD